MSKQGFTSRKAVLVGLLCIVINSVAAETPVEPEDTVQAVLPTETRPEPIVSPIPHLKQAQHIDLKDVVTEPLVTPLPRGDVVEVDEVIPTLVPINVEDPIARDLPVDEDSSSQKTPYEAVVEVGDEASKADTTQTLTKNLPVSEDLLSSEETLEEPAGAELTVEGHDRQQPLIMLDSEVPPATSTRLSWSPNLTFMGIAAPTAVLVVHGAKPGPKVCLTSAIHGDELNGIEVVRHVLYSIDPEELAGTVIGVPIVNLQGFRRSSRYLPDRRDLNRYFPGNAHGSSASRIAQSFFDRVIRHCDILVDMHTGSFHRTNMPQLRANLLNADVAELAKNMGSIVVVHSEGAQGCLRRAAVENGIPAVTLEAGQPHQLQKSAVTHGVKSVETLLDGLGMLDRRPFWEFASEPVYYQSLWVRATSGGILFSDVELGDRVKPGELLGVITDPITNLRQEVTAPYAGRVIGMALNQVMYPGFAAYHIGLQSSIDAVNDLGLGGDIGADAGDNEDGSPDSIDLPEVDEHDERILEDSE